MGEAIKIDIWSDVACPWCYIGKRRFEEAVAAFGAEDGRPPVDVEFHSFELTPDMPADYDGDEVSFLVERKGLPADRVEGMLAHVTRVAADAGLTFDFATVRPAPTADAHRLLHHAKAHGRQSDLKERLLRAHFAEGRDVGSHEELADLAAEVGLDRAEALEVLISGAYRDEFEADLRQAAQYGITGVPFFVIDGRYGVSGAQATETFTEVLRRVADERAEVAS